MCKKISNLLKIIISSFFISLSLQAGDRNDYGIEIGDFFNDPEIVSRIRPSVETVIKSVNTAKDKACDFVREHPKITAVAVGSIVSLLCLTRSESNLRQVECATFSHSSPGALKIPFQHGIKPFFVGALVSVPAVIVIQRSALEKLENKQSELIATALIESSSLLRNSGALCTNAESVSGLVIDVGRTAQNAHQSISVMHKEIDSLVETSRGYVSSIKDMHKDVTNTIQKSSSTLSRSQEILRLSETSLIKQQGLFANYKNFIKKQGEFNYRRLSEFRLLNASATNNAVLVTSTLETSKRIDSDVTRSTEALSGLDQSVREVLTQSRKNSGQLLQIKNLLQQEEHCCSGGTG